MIGWHLTWQDPVAAAVALACLGLVWWLRRRTAQSTSGCAGCGGCAAATGPGAVALGASAQIPAESLSIGRHRRA